MLFYVLFACNCVLPPGDNPTAVNKYIISYHFYNIRMLYQAGDVSGRFTLWVNPLTMGVTAYQ